MGIPRFYRYVSERYPLINQPISDVSLLPEFDCFYLDMNGIIHNCTHGDTGDGDDERNTLSLAQQLHAIFTYMDRLITHIIKPKQLVYIAIDGVAPRAKLNQQRSRRFRAGLDRMVEMEKQQKQFQQITLEDAKNGTTTSVAKKDHFDSNCITPGTEFLHALSAHLVYFVRQKMQTDPLWSRLQVFFSGSEVPGEGEHKIVEFIRHRKMTPDYEANVRHCMYGSDADLMLLGLMTHEPHFTLVREVVVWGKQHKKVSIKKIEEEQWQLVHLSLFREYLMMEMRVMPPFDGERMLDDFILLTFLLGNDFIPHSPTLEISEDAIPLLLRVYREHLEKYGGQYLTENGRLINLPLLQDLFQTIGSMEEDILSARAIEEAKRHGKRHGHGLRNERDPSPKKKTNGASRKKSALLPEEDEDGEGPLIARLEDGDDDDLPPLIDDDDEVDEEEFEKELLEALDGKFEAKIALEQEEEEYELLLADTLTGSESFQDTKWKYYERKFKIVREDNAKTKNEALEKVKRHYIEALVWCLAYYFQGPSSWSWYYPYHYAPMISDLTDIQDIVGPNGITFEDDDGPLLPFEQLMANLPASSAHLVPEPFRFLMVSPLSPIKYFYPEKFEIDMEGKRNAWEGVNLLPFIDSALLKQAITQYCPDDRLTTAEKHRNRLQPYPLRIVFDPKVCDHVKSTMPGVPGFPDIISCHTRIEEYKLLPNATIKHQQRPVFQSKLMDGVQLPLAGFPSLYTIPLAAVRIEHVRINCFGMGSRKATLILQLPQSEFSDPKALLGRHALVNWPHLHEALVVGVSTQSGEYRLAPGSNGDDEEQIVFTPYEPDQKTKWATYAQTEVVKLLAGRGTPGSGGIDVGKTGITCALHVLPLQGMVSNLVTGAVEKKFGLQEAVVPLQLAVLDRKLQDERYAETGPLPLEQRYPIDSLALIVARKSPWLGCTARVTGHDKNKVTVHVNTMDKEPPFGYVIAQQLTERYYPGYMVSQRVGMNASTIGLLVGCVQLAPLGIDIGLNLRFRKELVLPGYCRLVKKPMNNGNKPDEKDEKNDEQDMNVWRKGDIVQIVGSGIVEAANQQENPSNGQSTTMWEYTDRTIALLTAYKQQFPDVVARLESLPFRTKYDAKEVLGLSDKKKLEERAEAIQHWIAQQQLGMKEHSRHIPITSQYLSLSAMRAMEAAGAVRVTERKKHEAHENQAVIMLFSPRDLFRPNPLVNQDLTGMEISQTASRNVGAPVLGDRVINISARGVPFGHRGSVVATHVSSKCVEVLFDEGFTGGETLYGTASKDRGKIVPWNSLLCVSTPPGATERPAARPARSKQQQTNTKTKTAPFHQRKNTARPSVMHPHEKKPSVSSSSLLTPSIARQLITAKADEEQEEDQVPAVKSVPAPALPDPAKVQQLLQKWVHSGARSFEPQAKTDVNPVQTDANQVKIDGNEVSPSVAAFFSAAATPAAPPVMDLFPHNYAPAPPMPTPPPPPIAPMPPAPPKATRVAGWQKMNPPNHTSGPVSETEYPPLGAAKSKKEQKQWVPKTAKDTNKTTKSLLLPTQILRKQPKPSTAT